jgi:hypothetical protein
MTTLLLIAAEALDLTSPGDFRSAIKDVIEKKVNIVFVIHTHSRAKADLLRFAAHHPGSVRLMLVKDDFMEWTEQLVAVTRPGVEISESTLDDLEAGDIERGWEQFFRGGDLLAPDDQAPAPGKPLWKRLPYRQLNHLPAMLREWAQQGAEWR